MSVPLVPIREMSLKYGIKTPTLRLWIRSEQVAGTKGKPSLVNEASLVQYLEKQANGPLRRLFSGESVLPVSGKDYCR